MLTVEPLLMVGPCPVTFTDAGRGGSCLGAIRARLVGLRWSVWRTGDLNKERDLLLPLVPLSKLRVTPGAGGWY